MQLEKAKFVGDKAKGRISKQVLQENKAGQIFQKTNSSYPEICPRVHQGVRDVHFLGERNVRFSENLASFVFL